MRSGRITITYCIDRLAPRRENSFFDPIRTRDEVDSLRKDRSWAKQKLSNEISKYEKEMKELAPKAKRGGVDPAVWVGWGDWTANAEKRSARGPAPVVEAKPILPPATEW